MFIIADAWQPKAVVDAEMDLGGLAPPASPMPRERSAAELKARKRKQRNNPGNAAGYASGRRDICYGIPAQKHDAEASLDLAVHKLLGLLQDDVHVDVVSHHD